LDITPDVLPLVVQRAGGGLGRKMQHVALIVTARQQALASLAHARRLGKRHDPMARWVKRAELRRPLLRHVAPDCFLLANRHVFVPFF